MVILVLVEYTVAMVTICIGCGLGIQPGNWDFTGETKRGDKLKHCPEFLFERASVQGTMTPPAVQFSRL